MTTVYKYLRHSDDATHQPHSRQAQLNAIEAFLIVARQHDKQFAAAIDAGEFWDADVSGGTPLAKRPAGGVMLGRVSKGDIIITAAWDRIFRNSHDFENTLKYLDEVGVRLICLDMQVDTATSMGRFAARIIVAKGELERTQCSERIKSRTAVLEFNHGVKIAKGLPFGWKHDRRHEKTRKNGQKYAVYVPDYDDRYLCQRCVQLVDQKKLSFIQAARFLMRNNCKNPRAHGDNKVHWDYYSVRNRYRAAKAGFPCKDYDKVTGKNSEVLMIAVDAQEATPQPSSPS